MPHCPRIDIRRLALLPLFALALALGLPACDGGTGGGADAGGPGDGGGAEIREGLRATLDGKPWEAEAHSTTAGVIGSVPGTVSIIGTEAAQDSGRLRTISLMVYNVRGPGKYALGVGSTAYGGTGQVGESKGPGGEADSWITPGSGNDGEVDLLAIGNGRIKGTFSFTADTGRRNTTGIMRHVTGGSFDLPLAGILAPLPDHQGGRLGARLGAYAYNAATVTARMLDLQGQPFLEISTTASQHGLSLRLSGITAPGTYPLANANPVRVMTAGRNGGAAESCCWGSMAADTGSVIITHLSATRVKGTFRARLHPRAGAPAASPLEVAEGSFDVGIGI